MLVKIVCVFVLAGVCFAESPEYKIEERPVPFYELPCLAFGGICLEKTECPDGKLVGRSGLCPEQQKQGVECCYAGVAKSVKTCRENGGECIPNSWRCPQRLTFAEATNCEKDETCCIPIH